MGVEATIDLLSDVEEDEAGSTSISTLVAEPGKKRRRLELGNNKVEVESSVATFFRSKRTDPDTGTQLHSTGSAGGTANAQAVMLADALRKRGRPGKVAASDVQVSTSIIYLSHDAQSWVILAKKWWPSDKDAFQQQWSLHPQEYHPIKIFGRICHETRFSQSWGNGYRYSGSENKARPIEENPLVVDLLEECNEIAATTAIGPYNTCLQNWYQPEHSIALHSDDEKAHRPGSPIFSLSWGGPRRFVLKTKTKSSEFREQEEIWLHDGDLLVMGGRCQATHKHEVPKVRKKDPPATNRINWTIRAFA
mmetsp:Transcript_71661/g.133985  ORF Transcript_71661/g.133985 Transcript_71661/m.133985 type:complete len:307 (+) Transcript_71661:82-1002(+)